MKADIVTLAQQFQSSEEKYTLLPIYHPLLSLHLISNCMIACTCRLHALQRQPRTVAVPQQMDPVDPAIIRKLQAGLKARDTKVHHKELPIYNALC